jgi:hypothetical protein
MVCLGNICINTLQKGAKDDDNNNNDDDDNDNNNNNNNNNNSCSVSWDWLPVNYGLSQVHVILGIYFWPVRMKVQFGR